MVVDRFAQDLAVNHDDCVCREHGAAIALRRHGLGLHQSDAAGVGSGVLSGPNSLVDVGGTNLERNASGRQEFSAPGRGRRKNEDAARQSIGF